MHKKIGSKTNKKLETTHRQQTCLYLDYTPDFSFFLYPDPIHIKKILRFMDCFWNNVNTRKTKFVKYIDTGTIEHSGFICIQVMIQIFSKISSLLPFITSSFGQGYSFS